MSFSFSKEPRLLIVHHMSADRIYMASAETLIKAGEGLPAQSTITDLIECGKNQSLQLQSDDSWLAVDNFVGKIAYSKSGNAELDYIIEEYGPLPDTHVLTERGDYQSWDVASNGWKFDEVIYRPVLIEEETAWQQKNLAKIVADIALYIDDQSIPDIYSELRVTDYTEDNYYSLLGDRKLLVQYLEQGDFPECGRPTLSGVIEEEA